MHNVNFKLNHSGKLEYVSSVEIPYLSHQRDLCELF